MLGKWKIAAQLGEFMYQQTEKYGYPLKEDACHAIVKAYSWKKAKETVNDNRVFSGIHDSYSAAAYMAAKEVYGKGMGSSYAQEAAGRYLIITGHLPSNTFDEDDISHVRFAQAQSLAEEIDRASYDESSDSNEGSIEDFHVKAEAYEKSEEFKKAKKQYKKAVKAGDVSAHSDICRMCLKLEDGEGCHKWSLKGVKAGDRGCLLYLAESKRLGLGCKSDLNEAENLYREALIDDPEDTFTLNGLGLVYRQRQDWPNALYYLEKSARLETDPKFKEIFELDVKDTKSERAEIESL